MIVVAIDFGTSRSGYGYALPRHAEEIVVEQKWGGHSMKTRTDLLLNLDLTLHSFGDMAFQNYLELDAKDRSEYYFFSQFKMVLYGAAFHECPMIVAANGKKSWRLPSLPCRYLFSRRMHCHDSKCR